MFLDRLEELDAMERRWESGKPQFYVIFGRRRVGKSELILQFMRDKRGLYYEATAGSTTDHLEDITARLAELSENPLIAEQPLASWQAVLTVIGEELEGGPLVVALDEFQFVARQAQDIGSLLNRFWRNIGRRHNLFLILAGSDVSFFERDVMGYAATTYGRRTGSVRIDPFRPEDARLFLPDWDPEELILAYAVFGGMPFYLDAVDPGKSLTENILEVVLAPDAILREEPLFLLGQESRLREPDNYYSVLRAIAAGKTKQGKIAERAQLRPQLVNKILLALQDMRLIRKLHPVTVRNPERSKTSRYEISDPFLRFWFRFVLPFQARIHSRETAKKHLDGYIMPRLDRFASSPTFEEICQGWLIHETEAAGVGRWWGRVKEETAEGLRDVDREADAVAVDAEGHVLALGSCKWTAGTMPDGEREKCERIASLICRAGEKPRFFFFSRSGFDGKLVRQSKSDPERYRLVSVSDLYRHR